MDEKENKTIQKKEAEVKEEHLKEELDCKIKEMDYEQMKKILYDEILRRDGVIDTLKKENNLLLRTALKSAETRSIVETKKR